MTDPVPERSPAPERCHVPERCKIKAWRPAVDGISEVFHARIVNYAYPAHCHDTWTVLIVDTGAISYDLDKRHCGAVGDTVAILPPGVTHDGKPAPGAAGFTKRVLYLDEKMLPIDLVGAAVDQTNIDDPALRQSLVAVHQSLADGTDRFEAESYLALATSRIAGHLRRTPSEASAPDLTAAGRLRLILDEAPVDGISLGQAAEQLGRSKAHLVRSFTAAYGMTPHAYLIARRVEMARKLLLQGVQAAEVATSVGFYDQAHLTRHFKRHTSMAPGAFANSHAGDNR